MVVRDLACDVVSDVSLGNTVSDMCSDHAHDSSTIAKKLTVKCRECTTGEGKFRSAVVGEKRVGVLEERDQDEPVVDPVTHGTMKKDETCQDQSHFETKTVREKARARSKA